jgi:two-component system LytT family response regulator
MLRCIAIDDEPLALELLVDNISKVSFLQLAGAFNDPVAANSFLEQNETDLVFLDIQMPGLTGLQLVQSTSRKPMFIFITAYEKYALESYNLDVVDYLVKPVALPRFIKACNKAWELFQARSGNHKKTEKDHFFINVDYSQLKLVFNDIIYIEGLKDYTRINLKSSSRPVVARMSLKALEEELPASQFIRIHKSYIVSRQSITSVKKNSIHLGELELPIGDNYKDVVEEITGRK